MEQRIAARLWSAAGARVVSAGDYPLAPDTAVAFAHAACHGTVRTPKGGTPGAHLLLKSVVSERALLAGAPAGAWLMGACVGGRVHDDALDGNPTGIVAGALGAGSETVVAALPPLPDREAFFYGLLVTLQLAQAVGDGGGAGPADGPPDLVDAAALAGVILGGAREAGAVTAALPRRVRLALGGVDGIARRLARLDAGLRRALAEDLAEQQAEPLLRALDPGLTDAAGEALMLSERIDAIRAALEPASLGLVSAGAEGTAGETAEEDSCLKALSDTTKRTLAQYLARTVGTLALDQVPTASLLADRLGAAFEDLPRPFAALPDPDDPADHDPAAAGTIAHGIVTFHDPAHNTAAKGTAA